MDLKFQKSVEGLEMTLQRIEEEIVKVANYHNTLIGRKAQATETLAMMKETANLLDAPPPEAHECTAVGE